MYRQYQIPLSKVPKTPSQAWKVKCYFGDNIQENCWVLFSTRFVTDNEYVFQITLLKLYVQHWLTRLFSLYNRFQIQVNIIYFLQNNIQNNMGFRGGGGL